MTRSILFCVFALAGCGDNLKPETPQDAGPDEDAAPDAGPTPPEADGEYAIKISPSSFVCYDGPRQANEFYTLANIVAQEDPWKFDLLGGPQNSFEYYDRYNTPWEADGYFSNEVVNNVSFGSDIVVQANRFVEGSVNPDGSLNFFHRFDLGMYLEDDSWYSFCAYEGDIIGTRRYMPWDKTPRTSIDGQWRVKKTVVASPLVYPTPLPYVHFVTMDTITQAVDDSVFDIRGGIFHESLEWYALRNPTTGAVDAVGIQIIPNGTQTIVYETKLWGTLLPDVIDLQFSWKWYIQETGALQWFQHEHYEGVPRYNPHNNALVEPPQGAYNAEYKLVENNCGLAVYTEHRLLDVWLMDDGAVWPKITGFNIEPVVQLGPNGELAMSFSRYGNGEFYNYSFDNSTITGHAVDLNMTVNVIDISGLPVCTAKYKITGQKRYESYR